MADTKFTPRVWSAAEVRHGYEELEVEGITNAEVPEAEATIAMVYAGMVHVPSLICPCCGDALGLSAGTLQGMIREMFSWDRRFDGPETVLENLLSILGEGLSAQRGDPR